MNRLLPAALLLLFTALNSPACTACFGRSDSAMAKGMNMGIFFLLAVLLLVLGSIAAFFIFIIRRASRLEARTAPATANPPS